MGSVIDRARTLNCLDYSTMPPATAATVREYFFGEFVPAARAAGSRSTVSTFATRVRRFLTFAEPDVQISDVTENDLVGFEAWCRRQGFKPARARANACSIRTVLRSASGGRLFPRRTPTATPFDANDPPDGLRRLVLTRYAPKRQRMGSSLAAAERVVVRFGRHLGRVPTTADLSVEAIGEFIAAEQSRGRRGDAGRSIEKELFALWRFLAAEQATGEVEAQAWTLQAPPACRFKRRPPVGLAEPVDGLRRVLHERYAPARRLSPAAVHQFEVSLANYARFLGHAPALGDLSDARIQAFMASIVLDDRSPRTANRARHNLLALWRFLSSAGEIAVEPQVRALPEPRPQLEAWLPVECRKLWRSLGRRAGLIAGIPAADWWQSLHAILWDTGVTIAVALRTRWNQVDLENGWFTVLASDRKYWQMDACFRLPQHTLKLLRAIQEPARDLVWPRDFGRTEFYRRYQRLLEEAGLPTHRGAKTFKMRTSAASYYAAAGGDVRLLLGHRRRETTERHLDPRIVPFAAKAEGGVQ